MQINSIFNIPDDLIFDTLTFTVHGEDYGMGKPMKFSYDKKKMKYRIEFLGYVQEGDTITEAYKNLKKSYNDDLMFP